MAGGPRSIHDLPDEILLKILSHFGPEDLCFIIAEVCERWNSLSKDVTIWNALSYKCDDTSDISQVVQVLTVAPALHSLIIRGRKDAEQVLITVIDRPVGIRKLIMRDCHLGEKGTAFLNNIVALNPDLETLKLVGCNPMTSADYTFIPLLKKMSELNLSNCKGLCGEIVHLIADSCQHLKKLSLDEMYLIEDDDAIDVIKKLGKQLTTLVLNGESLTDVAYSYLHKCDRLQKLEVIHCKGITDRSLLEGIGSLQELTSLSLLNGYTLTAQALSTFLDRPSMTSIVLLNLSGCNNLDDKGLNRIAKWCVQLKKLLVVGCSNVTDAGISMVITNCSQLRVLDLNSLHHIRGHGWLPRVPAYLPHLRKLCLLWCNSACDDYIEKLVAAAPELQVIKPRGHILRNKTRMFEPR